VPSGKWLGLGVGAFSGGSASRPIPKGAHLWDTDSIHETLRQTSSKDHGDAALATLALVFQFKVIVSTQCTSQWKSKPCQPGRLS
jgi:hypothetical protein